MLMSHGVRDDAANDHVRHCEAAARLEDAKGFAEDAVFIGRKIDDAVGDDDVDGVIGERDVFDFAFEKFDIVDSCLALVFASQRQHFVGHVEAVGFAVGRHAAGGEEHVNAAAGAKVENGFAGLELDEGGGIAAAERSHNGFLGNEALFAVAVEICCNWVAAAQAGIATGLHAA